MPEKITQVIVAPKLAVQEKLPKDWQQQLRALRGVTIQGATPRRLQLAASQTALAAIRERFGDLLNVEDIEPRGIP